MAKILLIGAGGQLGSQLYETLRTCYPELTATVSKNSSQGFLSLDLTDGSAITSLIKDIKPNYIINAAAYTAVDRAEDERELALKINSEAVGIMAQQAKKLDATLIHYSTDYVFDGSGKQPWVETDSPKPINCYGQSKLAGEQLVQESGCRHYIFRTSWVYSHIGHNFLKTMLKLAEQHLELKIVADQWGTPTSAIYLATQTSHVLKTIDLNSSLRDSYAGLYHLSHSGYTNWAEFAESIFLRSRELNPIFPQIKVTTIPSKDYPRPAIRPLNSRLDCSKFSKAFDLPLSTWQEGLDEVLLTLGI